MGKSFSFLLKIEIIFKISSFCCYFNRQDTEGKKKIKKSHLLFFHLQCFCLGALRCCCCCNKEWRERSLPVGRGFGWWRRSLWACIRLPLWPASPSCRAWTRSTASWCAASKEFFPHGLLRSRGRGHGGRGYRPWNRRKDTGDSTFRITFHRTIAFLMVPYLPKWSKNLVRFIYTTTKTLS